MNGATQTLNELLAPVMNLVGIQDAWALVACAAALLFLLFFILFVSRCVKVSRLKSLVREKDDQITGLMAAANVQRTTDEEGNVQSVVFTSAGVTANLQDATRLFAHVDESGEFDKAWRSENSQFLEGVSAGTALDGDNAQASRHITDVIFGGAAGAATQSSEDEAAAAQEPAATGEGAPSLEQIRGFDLAADKEKSVYFPDTSGDAEWRDPDLDKRDQELSGRIPKL